MPRNLHVVVRLQAYPDIGGNTRRSLDSQNCFGGNGAFPVSETKISPLQIPHFCGHFALMENKPFKLVCFCSRLSLSLADAEDWLRRSPYASTVLEQVRDGIRLKRGFAWSRHNQSKLCFCSRLSLSLSICSYVLLPGRTMPSGIEAPKHNR